MLRPDLNEVRVQHRTTGCNVWPGPERSEGGHSQKRPHKKSAANLKHCRRFRIGHREPERGEGSCPDWKRQPTARMLRPDLNVVRAQHLGTGREYQARTRNEVRVRPHKKSAANYTNGTLVRSLTANPNAVRVRPRTISMCPDWVGLTANPNMVRVRARTRSIGQPLRC